MPTNLWAGLGGPSVYAFDGDPHTWSSAIGLGSTASWTTGLITTIAQLHVDWHYGGPWLQNGLPGGISGAAGPFKLQGSNDEVTWYDVVVDANPEGTWGASYPGDFSGDYVVDPPVGYYYWRWTNTSGANNDWYQIAGYGPEEPPPPPPPSGPILTINGVVFTSPKEATIRVEDNAAGEGFIVLDRWDPQATAANLQRGNIATVTIPEIDPDQPIFAFILQDGDWDVVSSDEEGGEELRFSGPGVMALLHRVVISPDEYETGTGYPKPRKGYWEFADGVTEGHILNKLMREAESASRPTDPLPGVSDDFTSVLDSNGVAWGDEVLDGKWRVPIGADLYDEVQRLVAAGLLGLEMTPDLVLHAYRTHGTDRGGTSFGPGVVRFAKAVNIADEVVRSQQGRDFASYAFIRYGDGDYTETAKNGSWPYEQETFIEANTTSAATARRMAKGQMGWREGSQDAPAFAVRVPWPGAGNNEEAGIYLPGPEWSANGLYWVGDIVTLYTGSELDTDYDNADFRVYAITLRLDETGYLAPPLVELGAPYTPSGSSDLRSSPSVGGTTGLGGSGGSSGSSGGGTFDVSGLQRVSEKGEPDGYASLDGSGLVPYTELGTGGDGSGDNVLHDDGTWGASASSLTVKDEGTPLATAASTIDFVGAGVVASGAGADKTVTVSEPTADAHVADTSDAHDASAVSFDATGLTQTSATDVQQALEDLDAAIDAGGGGGGGGGASVETESVKATGDVTLSTNNWVDVLSLTLPSGSNYNVRGAAHFDLSASAGWMGIRIVDGSSVVLIGASDYLNNAATESQLFCEAPEVAGGQTVKLQAFTDVGGTNKVTQYNGFGSGQGVQTELTASPAASGTGTPAGTSFPGSPSTGQQYFRTDQGIEYYYDGARWLSKHVETTSFPPTQALSAITATANVGRLPIPWRGTSDIYVLGIDWLCVVSPGHSSSNYFTLKLNWADQGDSDTQLGTTLDSKTATTNNNNYTFHDRAINAVLSSSARELKARVDLVGTGVGFTYITAVLSYRLVG